MHCVYVNKTFYGPLLCIIRRFLNININKKFNMGQAINFLYFAFHEKKHNIQNSASFSEKLLHSVQLH